MAKREILFNDEVYSIEESVIEASLAEMKSRLVDGYSGSGTTIVYDGTTINVDSAKLAAAASSLAATLNKFAGSGASIVVNGVTYGIDSAKLNSAKENMGGTLSEMAGAAEEEDELAGTWVFNDTLILPYDQVLYYVNFVNGETSYTTMGERDPEDPAPDDMWFYGTTVVYNDLADPTWKGEAYRTITITSNLSEVTNGSTLLTWLKANATKQEENQTDSIVGTWVFNDNLYDVGSTSLTWKGLVQVPFSSGSYSSLSGMQIGNGTLSYLISGYNYVNNGASVYSGLNGGSWNTSVYKTITILSDEVVTDTTEWSVDEFKAWLKANATKQGTATLISFTIDGTSYQAEDGMTWEQWIASEYNTDRYAAHPNLGTGTEDSKVPAKNQYCITYNSSVVSFGDLIIANASYGLRHETGAGGAN